MSLLTIFMLAALLFVAIGGVLFAISSLSGPSKTASERLADLNPANVVEASALTNFEDEVDQETALGGMLDRVGDLAKPASQEELGQLRRRLVQAGYKSRHAMKVFSGLRVGLAIVFPMFVAPFASALSLEVLAGAVIFMAAAGYYLPWLGLNNVIEKRKGTLLAAFPDALDLMVSSVEAGLGIDAAFRRVAQELQQSCPELGREFQLVNHEISAGVPRVEALRHLEQRTGMAEIRSLVNMLSQAERFGTSIANSLRVHSRVTREKRMSRAEEEAAKVSPKMTVVMILFLMPCLMVILLGPAAIRVMDTLGVTNEGSAEEAEKY